MNEVHYLELDAAGTDAFLGMIGAGTDYVAQGNSFFTAESHVRYLNEVHEGGHVDVLSQVLGGHRKKLHLFHSLIKVGEICVATVEILLVHVDLGTRRSCPPQAQVQQAISQHA